MACDKSDVESAFFNTLDFTSSERTNREILLLERVLTRCCLGYSIFKPVFVPFFYCQIIANDFVDLKKDLLEFFTSNCILL